MGGASHSDVTIKPNKSVGEIPVCQLICPEHFVHSPGFGFVEEVKYQLNKVTCHVWVRRNFLL